MKNLILIIAVLTLTLSCSSSSKKSRGSRSPTHDQYWNDMSNEATTAHARITDVLKENNPALYNQLLLDSKDPILPMFWGKSLNFDSGAKKIIVDEKIIEDLQRIFNIKNDNRIVHAGIMHTYGYLFSTIDTPYGYKRKRWIEPTLNTAFGLTGNSLSPETIDGGLLSNLTYFAGMFVLSDKTQLQALKNVSNEIIAFDYTKQAFERVEESTKNFTLITTLIKFPVKPEGDDNDYLLIYSIDDKRVQKEFLITAFPINTDSYKKIVAPETLGENQKITLRYNAYLEGAGVTSLIGERKLIKK